MIVEDIKNIKSEKKDLRKFAITIGIVLGLLTGLFLWRSKDYYYYFLIFSAAFLLLGIIAPILLRPFHKIWMTLAVLLGWFVTRALLAILFYLVVTPIGLLSKLFGKDFLNLKFNKNTDSYWMPRKKIKFEKTNYEKQF